MLSCQARNSTLCCIHVSQFRLLQRATLRFFLVLRLVHLSQITSLRLLQLLQNCSGGDPALFGQQTQEQLMDPFLQPSPFYRHSQYRIAEGVPAQVFQQAERAHADYYLYPYRQYSQRPSSKRP